MNFFTRFAETTATTTEWIQNAALAIEGLAVIIMVLGVTFGTARFLYYLIRHRAAFDDIYLHYKHRVAKSLLLGLEILVAADVIRTVALEPTLENIAALGLLVLVRTFLSWSLVVEMESRWPWQPRRSERIEDTL
jgi:uncharacterized membrane protein